MGNNATLALKVVDSPTDPGQKSIVSAEIPHDYDTFVEEFLQALRYPVMPHEEPVLKGVHVTEDDGPENFSVRAILDGQKLTRAGIPDPNGENRDLVSAASKVMYNREERSMYSVLYLPHYVGERADTIYHTVQTRFLKDPFRAEFWWITPGGDRKADDDALTISSHFYNIAMAALVDRKVTVKPDTDNQMFVTGPIDESIVRYEAFFDALLDWMKGFHEPRIEVVSEGKLKFTFGENPAESPYVLANFDKDAGTISTTQWNLDGTVKLEQWNYAMTKSPFELQIKHDVLGERQTGKGAAKKAQFVVDLVIAKASRGWFGLW